MDVNFIKSKQWPYLGLGFFATDLTNESQHQSIKKNLKKLKFNKKCIFKIMINWQRTVLLWKLMLPHLASIELWGRAERGTINVSHPVINHHCCQHHHRQTRIQTRRHTLQTHRGKKNVSCPVISQHCCQHQHEQTRIETRRVCVTDIQTHRGHNECSCPVLL